MVPRGSLLYDVLRIRIFIMDCSFLWACTLNFSETMYDYGVGFMWCRLVYMCIVIIILLLQLSYRVLTLGQRLMFYCGVCKLRSPGTNVEALKLHEIYLVATVCVIDKRKVEELEESTWTPSARVRCSNTCWCLCIYNYNFGVCRGGNYNLMPFNIIRII